MSLMPMRPLATPPPWAGGGRFVGITLTTPATVFTQQYRGRRPRRKRQRPPGASAEKGQRPCGYLRPGHLYPPALAA